MSGETAAPATVAIVTLGCARNEVDSDQLAALLRHSGYHVVDDASGADAVIVNTCTFIEPAKQESIDVILDACDLKGGSTKAVVVAGCMAERYPTELAAAIPEADAIVSFDAYPRLGEIVEDLLAGRAVERVATAPVIGNGRKSLPLADGPRPQDDLDRIPASGPRFPMRAFDGKRPWAYLKIASGCDRVCTFCAIPSFRGRFRSRPLDELEAEARWLVDQGARELVLVSENTTSWGKDLGGRSLQPQLLERLSKIEELLRLRLMYLQPAELTDELLGAMASLPKVASYYDLSLQHVSASVLDAMARSGSPDRFRELVGGIRDRDPGAVFRSNFIIGFPGETDDDVSALADFLDDMELDWVGLFPFSVEDGTPSAEFEDQVQLDVAEDRLEHVRDVAERAADRAARRFVGSRLEVLVEDVGDGVTAGRCHREAPETDGEVRLVSTLGDQSPVTLPIGRVVDATVVAADGVDLIAVCGPDA